MANEKRLVDVTKAIQAMYSLPETRRVLETNSVARKIIDWFFHAPTVDAVELPKGRPGDYLEWDNGTGIKQIYCIHAVMICEDCIRYDLEKFSPVVDHPGIVRITSIEEAEKEWHEMCAKAMPREEPTLTAVFGERKDND